MALNRDSLNQLKIERPEPTEHPSRAPLAILALAVAAVVLIAWWWWNRPAVRIVETALAREVASAPAGATLLNASGYVTARREATVSSKVTGRVTEVLVEEGTRVEEGQVLARLDDANTRAALRLAEAQLESARRSLGETGANLEQARRTLKRTRDLLAARVVSEAELDAAVAAVDSLGARLERQRADIAVAESEVAVWRQQVDDTVIRAPFAGIVTSKNAQPGEMISPMSAGGGYTRTGICTIVDMESLEVEVDVNESYINRVSPGQPVIVTLDAYPDWPVAAEVIAIVPTADRQKATVRVRVGFARLDPRILPDMGLKVAFRSGGEPEAGQASPAVVVPRRALKSVEGRDVVWVVRDGRVERRAVSVAGTAGDDVTLAAGVRAGERVVVGATAELRDGDTVRENRTRS